MRGANRGGENGQKRPLQRRRPERAPGGRRGPSQGRTTSGVRTRIAPAPTALRQVQAEARLDEQQLQRGRPQPAVGALQPLPIHDEPGRE